MQPQLHVWLEGLLLIFTPNASVLVMHACGIGNPFTLAKSLLSQTQQASGHVPVPLHLMQASRAALTSLAYIIDSTGQQPPHLMLITYKACEPINVTHLCLWPEALLFTSAYTQLHVPYDLASNGTALSRIC